MVKSRLRSQLFLLLLLLTAAAAVTTAAVGLQLYRAHLYRQSSRNLAAAARTLANLLPPPSVQGPPYQEFCREAVSGTGLRLTIVNEEGRVLGDSHKEPARMNNHASRPEIEEARKGRTGLSLRRSITLREARLYAALGHSTPAGRLYIRTSIPYQALTSQFRSVLLPLLLLTALLILLAAGLSFFLAQAFSRRMKRLQEQTRRFARGDFREAALPRRTDEFREIHRSLNQMGKQLQERLETVVKQKNELRAVLHGMQEPVIVLTPQLTLKSLNPAAENQFRINGRDAAGRELLEMVRSSRLYAFARRTLQEETLQEETIPLDLGGYRHMQVHGSILRNIQESIRGILLVFNDVSQLKQVEIMQKDFVSNVSHELKTPITSIKGYVETLQDTPPGDQERLRRFLAIIDTHTDRLNSIIEDLLILSRIEKNREDTLSREDFPLQDLLESVTQVSRERAAERTIRLETAAVPSPALIRVHPLLAEQALVNLTDNAVKYSPPGSCVRLTAEIIPPESGPVSGAVIHVEDEGPGIPPAEQERIFERFYRIDKARSREAGGTGLGLSIVKHIAETHGGWVRLRSLPGKGSRFSLFFPPPKPPVNLAEGLNLC